MNAPTISIGIDKEADGTFTAKLLVTGLPSIAQAQAAANHMQRMFCGEEIDMADQQPNTPAETRQTAQAEQPRNEPVQQEPMPGMSAMNRTIAYCAASKLRSIGYEWDGSDWAAPQPRNEAKTK